MLLAFSGWTRKQRKIVSYRGLFKQYIEYLYRIKSMVNIHFKMFLVSNIRIAKKFILIGEIITNRNTKLNHFSLLQRHSGLFKI